MSQKIPYSDWNEYFRNYHNKCYVSTGIKRRICESYHCFNFMNSGIRLKWNTPNGEICSSLIRTCDGKILETPICNSCQINGQNIAQNINGYLKGVTLNGYKFE